MNESGGRIIPVVSSSLILLFILQVAALFYGVPKAISGAADFRMLYISGNLARTDPARLYDVGENERLQKKLVSPDGLTLAFDHLAYEAVAFIPISFLPFKVAYFVFFAVNLALLAVSARWLKPLLQDGQAFKTLMLIGALTCFFPVVIVLIQEQDSIIVLTLLIFAYMLLSRGREAAAGAVVALTLFKFQFALPIAFLYVCWRRWSFVRGFAVTATPIVGLSVGLTGLHAQGQFLSDLGMRSLYFINQSQSFVLGEHPQAMPNLRGFLETCLATTVPHLAVEIAILLCCLMLFGWLCFARPSLPLAVTGAFLVSYHCLIHDMTILLLPITLGVTQAIAVRRSAVRVAASIAVFVAPVLCALGGIPNSLIAVPILLVLWTLRSPNEQSPATCAES